MTVMKKTKTTGSVGTLIKVPKRATARSLSIEYYKQHARCPKCFGNKNMKFDYNRTLNIKSLDGYEDGNRCECICGWIGTVHERLPREVI